MKIIIDLEKGVDQNAANYFEKSKKLKKKIEGVKKAISNAEKRLDDAKKNSELKKKVTEKKEKEKSRKKDWFEKFRWFISSDGFLVIGGKDASSNEVVIRKHTDKDDLVFHTEAPGSPFFVIKSDGKEIPTSTKEETAIAALTFSRAWSAGIKSAEVYEIKPEQVSKEAKAGEYLAKGAFMIYGKRNYYNPLSSLAIGIMKNEKGENVIMSGPESAVKKHCKNVMVLKHGNKKKGEISKVLMKKLDVHTNDDIISALPAGTFDVSK